MTKENDAHYCCENIGDDAVADSTLNIVDNVHITAMSLVTKSIKRAGSYSAGTPINNTKLWRKNAARFNQLDHMARQLIELKKQ